MVMFRPNPGPGRPASTEAGAAGRRAQPWSCSGDGVSLALLHRGSGRPVRGPLPRGAEVTLEVVLDLPDAPARYRAVAGPVEVIGGSVGAGEAPAAATVRLGPKRPRARIPVRIPAGPGPVRLVVDLLVAGNTVRSLALIGRPAGGFVHPGPTEVLYTAGGLDAAELGRLEPVDAMVSLHGDPAGGRLTAWTRQDRGSRSVTCHQVSAAEVGRAAERYRRHLDWLAHLWSGTGGRPTARDVIELARAGADLRHTVLGSVAPLAPEARVVVACDPHVGDLPTLPWAGLYEGRVADGGESLCVGADPGRGQCADHGPEVVCPGRFWGLRFELASPDGGWPTEPAADRSAGDGRPIRLLDIVGPELRSFDHLPGLAPPAVLDVARASTLTRIDHQLAAGPDVDLLVLLASSCWGDGTQEAAGGFALELDRPVGPRLLRGLAERHRLAPGPIVVLNACYTGVMGPNDRYLLVDELGRLGARGVVVSGTEIDPRAAARLSAALVTDLLAGHTVSAALLRARRREWEEQRSLARLSYSFVGPLGLRLAHPAPGPRPELATGPAARQLTLAA